MKRSLIGLLVAAAVVIAGIAVVATVVVTETTPQAATTTAAAQLQNPGDVADNFALIKRLDNFETPPPQRSPGIPTTVNTQPASTASAAMLQ